MKAKEYLSQIRVIEEKLKHRREQCERLRSAALNAPGVRCDGDRIIAPPKDDAVASRVIRYCEMKEKADETALKLEEVLDQLIGDIHRLDKREYIQLLYKRYVEEKSLELIAVETHRSYDWVRHMHGAALAAFEKKVLKKEKKV